ncbi:MAG: thioredoxin-disulfide reductase [Euryarchaeota archaeon]|nr:thioredoxin-disulfide reductase [Euryarchaeota archaeon]
MKKYDLIVIGAGPAGLTAGIYGGRAGLRTAIIDAGLSGGQLLTVDIIENWPGEITIKGSDLAKKMKDHASKYADIYELTEVKNIKKKNGEFIVGTSAGEFTARAIIFATGAKRKRLNVPGEKEFLGKGVSYCAVCDGSFFIGKKVIVVGGGNTAFSDAIYLKGIGVDVTIVHRRKEFRAFRALINKAKDLGIEFRTPYIITEIMGTDKVRKVVLKNVETGEIEEMIVDGVFIAIGLEPNSKIARELGVEVDEQGFIKVDRNMRTNVPYVYAAGDVTGGIMQIVKATAEGAIAALSAHEDLSHG